MSLLNHSFFRFAGIFLMVLFLSFGVLLFAGYKELNSSFVVSSSMNSSDFGE